MHSKKRSHVKKTLRYNLLLSILVLAMICVGGTIAYLEASDSPVLNTFALADVHTRIEEGSDGSEESKVVSVTNTSTESPAFVRARVLVSAGTSAVQWVGTAPAAAERAANTVYVVLGSGWEAADGYYYYQQLLQPQATTATPLVNGVYCGTGVDTETLDVIVSAEAVLGSGAYSLAAAQAAFQAVD